MSYQDRMKSQDATNKSLRACLLEIQVSTEKAISDARDGGLEIRDIAQSIRLLAADDNYTAIMILAEAAAAIADDIIKDMSEKMKEMAE